MSFYKVKAVLVFTSLLVGLVETPASAAGSKPKLDITCGQIIGGVDENGTFGLFKPKIRVSHYGKPLDVTAYFYETPSTPKSETGRTIWKLSGKASSSTFFVSNLELERKLLPYGMQQTGYYKIVFEAVDSLKRKGTFSCIYKDYYFDTPMTGSNNGFSNSGFSKASCSFNRQKLSGSVYFTSNSVLADFKVFIASSSIFSDLNVYLTGSSVFASSCGHWYQTSNSVLADFSVYITSSPVLADFSIFLTDSSIFAGTS